MRPHFAYVFERFPTFTQTFCAREVLELERQGVRPLIFSIRDTRHEAPRHFPDSLYDRVHFLPPERELVEWVKHAKKSGQLPQEIVLSLRHWGDRPDKLRVYEAAYIGHQLREAGVRHVHSHFAGLGARVCWWLRQAWDCTFSFTGHANDLWCAEPHTDVTLERLMEDASLIVTVSDFAAADLRQRFPGAARRVRRVYNGLDLGPFIAAGGNRRPAPSGQELPFILSVGRLIEKKGYPDLIEACALLKEKGLTFRCEIAGDGPLEAELQSLISSRQMVGEVHLLGPTPQESIIGKLGQTTVFVLACATEKDGGMDNLPTVLMEAMAAAVPCISTRLAGVPEMVEHEVTGLLTSEKNPEELAAAIARLLRDPELARRMGEAGQLRARQLFAQASTARQLLQHLVSHGLVRFDAALARRHPALWPAYGRQAAKRLARLGRFRRFRHRGVPDFLAPAPGQ